MSNLLLSNKCLIWRLDFSSILYTFSCSPITQCTWSNSLFCICLGLCLYMCICLFFVLCVYLFWAYSMCICPHKKSPAAYLLYQIYDYLSLSICLRKRNKCCSGRCTWAVVIVFCRCPWFSASFCLWQFVFVFVYLSVTICFCVRNSSCSGQCLWAVVIVFCRCPWFRASFCLCLCIKIVAAADVCGQLSFPLESRRRGGEMIHTVIEQ